MPLAYIKVLNRGPSEVDPDYGVDIGGGIDNSLPPGTPPIGSTLPEPPPGVWPPPSFSNPIAPTQPIALPPEHVSGQPVPPPSGSTKPPPGTIWPPTVGAPSGTFWVVAGIPGIGWRYICVDPSLGVDNTLPGGAPPRVDAGLPPSAAPKR